MIWDKICKICKKDFEAKSLNVVYCSFKCRTEGERKQNLEYVKSWQKRNRKRTTEIHRNYMKRRSERLDFLEKENKKLRKQLQEKTKGDVKNEK